MDMKRLRTFVAVADLGTVSKAALRQRISQSALSRQISDLEYECGFKLFDRIGRRLFLTTRGEQLLGDCRGINIFSSVAGRSSWLAVGTGPFRPLVQLGKFVTFTTLPVAS